MVCGSKTDNLCGSKSDLVRGSKSDLVYGSNTDLFAKLGTDNLNYVNLILQWHADPKLICCTDPISVRLLVSVRTIRHGTGPWNQTDPFQFQRTDLVRINV